jgi:hypothetical protein
MSHLLAPTPGVLVALQYAALFCNDEDGACSADWLRQQTSPLSHSMMLLLLLNMSLPTSNHST